MLFRTNLCWLHLGHIAPTFGIKAFSVVGLIVGLIFASSLYIWNNDKFSGLQKTILLICIIFPPAQWIGILFVLAYNNYKVNNSTEKVIERKVEQVKANLDNSISNLKDLKEKGILTDEEYKTKVAKISTEKDEQSLKNSLEYKQLKSLRHILLLALMLIIKFWHVAASV